MFSQAMSKMKQAVYQHRSAYTYKIMKSSILKVNHYVLQCLKKRKRAASILAFSRLILKNANLSKRRKHFNELALGRVLA